jgi:hypothetical protein
MTFWDMHHTFFLAFVLSAAAISARYSSAIVFPRFDHPISTLH